MAEFTHQNGNHLHERAMPLFHPDPIVPDRYFDAFHGKESLEPEKRLMLAVLEDGIHCFQKYFFARDRKGRALVREIEDWILGEDSGWVFSFEHICEALRLDPQYVRQGLMRWKENEIVSRAKIRGFRLDAEQARPERRI